MGDYTLLKVKCYIKPKWREYIDVWNGWKKIAEFSNNEKLMKFSELDGAASIPFCSLAYYDYDPKFEFDWNLSTGYLQFQCHVKYGTTTIENFVNEILPIIAESVIDCVIDRSDGWEEFFEGSPITAHEVKCNED